jgi:hypothetical protein
MLTGPREKEQMVRGVFMRVSLALLSALIAMSISYSALAATVNAIQGQVLVNTGQGYRQVGGTAQAGPGATVVANPGGQGQVTYPDGCAVTVLPGTVYTIAPNSPCQTGIVPLNGTTLAIGAVVAGGIGAAIILSQKDKSASP